MKDADKHKDLRKKLGLKKNQMISTNKGALDVFTVKRGRIYYGFVGTGHTDDEPIDDFIKRFARILEKVPS